jgi:putative oxidoreductase
MCFYAKKMCICGSFVRGSAVQIRRTGRMTYHRFGNHDAGLMTLPPKRNKTMDNKFAYAAPAGRALLALIFILSGVQKIGGYEATQGYMEFMGVPGALLPLVILVEVLGGIALLIGFQVRIAAIALAGFTIIAGALFHLFPSFGMEGMAAQGEVIHFMKNLSIAGGLLFVAATGAGAWSVDNRRANSMVAAE